MAEAKAVSSTNAPIWVAVIGAIVTGVGYVSAYFKDIEIQSRKERQEFILKLLREDPRDSSQNLIWAHGAGLVKLDAETVEKLSANPFSAPTVSQPASVQAAPTDDLVIPDTVSGLIASLDSPLRAERYKALEKLEIEHSADPSAVKAAVLSLSEENVDRLSANGRYNILYFLDRVKWAGMLPGLKAEATSVLNEVTRRSREGIAEVGPKTMDLLKRALAQIEN